MRVAGVILLAGCLTPVAEPSPLPVCTAGWEVETETELKAPGIDFPRVVPLDHGVYAELDGGWQWLEWNGTPRGPLRQLPAGTGEVRSGGDRMLVTRRSSTGVAVHALERDGGLTRYATIPLSDSIESWPYEAPGGVLVFSQLPDGGVRLDKTTRASSERVPYADGRWPRGFASVGSGLLLLVGFPGDLEVLPLTGDGRLDGSKALVSRDFAGEAVLAPCGSGAAALATSRATDDGGHRLELRWLGDDGKTVKGPVPVPAHGFFPNVLCTGDQALVAWSQNETARAILSFAHVSSSGAVTPQPLALSDLPATSNWYPVLRPAGDRLGLSWLRYSDAARYSSMLASLRCAR